MKAVHPTRYKRYALAILTAFSVLLFIHFLPIIFLPAVTTVILVTRRVMEIIAPHSYSIDYERIFETQFQVYILTHACDRETPVLSEHLKSVILVPDVLNSSYCQAINQTQLHLLQQNTGESKDTFYRHKYAAVLQHCAQQGKAKCWILEDDVYFIPSPKKTIENLIYHTITSIVHDTITLFINEDKAYDCTKRGIGWFPSQHVGMGSQCRIYSKHSSECMSQCIQTHEQSIHADSRLDAMLKTCQPICGLKQARVLWTQHGGYNSIMDRKPKAIDEALYTTVSPSYVAKNNIAMKNF